MSGGVIIRRTLRGAVVLTQWEGQDNDGCDLFGAVGYELWDNSPPSLPERAELLASDINFPFLGEVSAEEEFEIVDRVGPGAVVFSGGKTVDDDGHPRWIGVGYIQSIPVMPIRWGLHVEGSGAPTHTAYAMAAYVVHLAAAADAAKSSELRTKGRMAIRKSLSAAFRHLSMNDDAARVWDHIMVPAIKAAGDGVEATAKAIAEASAAGYLL
jgi:hypothetical protein